MTTPIKVDMAFALKEWWKRMTRKIPKLVKHTGLMSLRISFWSIIGQKMVVRSRGLFNQSMGRASITVERNLPTVDHRIISILNLSASVRLFPVEKPTDSNTFFFTTLTNCQNILYMWLVYYEILFHAIFGFYRYLQDDAGSLYRLWWGEVNAVSAIIYSQQNKWKGIREKVHRRHHNLPSGFP